MTDNLLFGLLLTLACWHAARALRIWSRLPLFDPVLLSAVVIIALLLLLDIPHEHFHRGARFITFLLGPAVVALAVPFCRQFEKVRSNLPAVLASVAVGGAAGIVSSSGLVYLLGGSIESFLSIAPKSVTTPIAMEVSEVIGGTPPLTVAVVVLTGVLGGMLGPELLRLIGIKDDFAAGIALGTAAHGVGTARAFQESNVMGAMSGVGMTLNGAMTAIFLTLLARLFG